jgi:uncharacterized protein YecE (DUF72 family)
MWYLGTMGFAYQAWSGVFYPADMPRRQYLAHYSQVFNAVELDNTFYGTPRDATVRRWADSTPVDFRFCPKVPKEITHQQQLDLDQGAGEAMDAFLDTMSLLGKRLGPVLIQLPPGFTAAQTPQLERFLSSLSSTARYAVEFRHRSWYTAQTADLLRDHNVAWVCLDYLQLPRQVTITTDFLYIRWIGQHGRFEQRGREEIDVSRQLAWWWEELQPYLDQVPVIYGLFNDDFAGYAPGTLNQFQALAGLPVTRPEIVQQGRLF